MKKMKLLSFPRKRGGPLESLAEKLNEKIDVYFSDQVFEEYLTKHNAVKIVATLLSREVSRDAAVVYMTDDRLHSILFHDLHIGHGIFGKAPYLKYLKLFQEKTNLKGIAVLNAHGDDSSGEWVYIDQGKEHKVQDWINKNDGRYGCLILFCCNPGSLTPTSEKSLLVVPDEVVSGFDIKEDRCHYSLIDPYHGEVSEYTVESDLREAVA